MSNEDNLNSIKQKASEITDLVNKIQAQPVPTTSSAPVEQVVVTPANKTRLTNLGDVDFSGSTTEYIQMRSPGGHAMPTVLVDYENASIEAEVEIISSSEDRLVQLQLRGGRHSDDHMCDGSAYKGSFENTLSTNRKEIFHRSSSKPGGNGYCADKDDGSKAYRALKGRKAKIRLEVRNLAKVGAITPVQLRNYVDDVLVLETLDKGDWSWTHTNLPACPARQFDNTGNRKPNEILNKAGSWAIFRFDGNTIVRLYKLTVKKL